ncbi:MAG TPA: aspartyl protease family protein [Chthoniobacter sp.]|jgi:hypothetical protein
MARPTALLALLLAALTIAPLSASASPSEIPFTYTDGYIRLEAHIPQSREPLYLLLDSGAGASVLSMRTAQRLHIPFHGTQNIRGVGVDVAASELQGVRATANGVDLATISLAVDLSAADQLCSRPIDGLVGVDFFCNRVVQIDYAHHVLRISPEKPDRTADRLPVKFVNDVMCLPICVNGSPKRWARFDTGCNDELHWVIPRSVARNDHNAVSIGFITDESDSALTSVTLGKHALSTVKTALHGRPIFPGEAGLVGNGVLSQFTVTVDWPNHQIYLQDAPSR